MTVTLELQRRAEAYAVALLPADAAIPDWADGPGLVSIGRYDDELSVVCPATRVPDGVHAERGWTAYAFAGEFAFTQTGVMLSVIRPLSEAEIGVFAVSTFRRDYLLVKAADAGRAEAILTAHGHRVRPAEAGP